MDAVGRSDDFFDLGGNSLSATQVVAAVLAALSTATIPVNVKQMNDAPVIGDGAEGNPWRGVGVPP